MHTATMTTAMIKSNYILPSASRITKLSSFSLAYISSVPSAPLARVLITIGKNLCGGSSYYHQHHRQCPHHHSFCLTKNYLTGNLASTASNKFTGASTRKCIVVASDARLTTAPQPPPSSLVADKNNDTALIAKCLPVEIAKDTWTGSESAPRTTTAEATTASSVNYDGFGNKINNKWSVATSATKAKCCSRQYQLLKHNNQIRNNPAAAILAAYDRCFCCFVQNSTEANRILSLANSLAVSTVGASSEQSVGSTSMSWSIRQANFVGGGGGGGAKCFAYSNRSTAAAANGLNKLMTDTSALSSFRMSLMLSLATKRPLTTATKMLHADGVRIDAASTGHWHSHIGCGDGDHRRRHRSHVNYSARKRNEIICQSRLLLSNSLTGHGTIVSKKQYPINIEARPFSSSSLFGGADGEDGGQDRNCWRCDKPINVSKSKSELQNEEEQQQQPKQQAPKPEVAVCEHCGSIQPIENDVNLFTLFQLKLRYDVDLAALRQQYLRLQQNMHPDMNVNRSNTESGYSLDNSSIINSAYKTLRDPYQRALYMLKICYNITIDEGNIETEPELLLEIMELNEDIEEASGDKQCLMDLQHRLQESIDSIVSNLKVTFDVDNNGCEARNLTIRFAYYQTALDKLRTKLVNV